MKGSNYSLTTHYLKNTRCGVGFPIWAFLSRSHRVWPYEAERYCAVIFFVVPQLVLWTLSAQSSTELHQSGSVPIPGEVFVRFQHLKTKNTTRLFQIHSKTFAAWIFSWTDDLEAWSGSPRDCVPFALLYYVQCSSPMTRQWRKVSFSAARAVHYKSINEAPCIFASNHRNPSSLFLIILHPWNCLKMALQVAPNAEARSLCIWHRFSTNNAFSSSPAKDSALLLREQSSTSKSPCLKKQKHPQQVGSLKTACPDSFGVVDAFSCLFFQ